MGSSGNAAGRAASRVMYGRREDVARLAELLDEVIAERRTGLAVVEGDAGIGKTRTVSEFAASARARGDDVLTGRCVDLVASPLPYAPLVELLGELSRREGAARVASIAGPTAAELARLVPALGLGKGSLDTTQGSVSRLFQALCSLLDHLAEVRPLVVVIEDVHWADPSTRDLVTLLVHQLRSPVMVVLTLRGDEGDDDRDGGDHAHERQPQLLQRAQRRRTGREVVHRQLLPSPGHVRLVRGAQPRVRARGPRTARRGTCRPTDPRPRGHRDDRCPRLVHRRPGPAGGVRLGDGRRRSCPPPRLG